MIYPDRIVLTTKLIYIQLYSILLLLIIRTIKGYRDFDINKQGLKIIELFNYDRLKKALFIISIICTILIIYLNISESVIDILYLTGVLFIIAYVVVSVSEIIFHKNHIG